MMRSGGDSVAIKQIAGNVGSLVQLKKRFPDLENVMVGGFAEPAHLHLFQQLLDERRPKTIVEFGCGVSTHLFATWAHENGAQVVSFEHDRGWAESTQKALDRAGLRHAAKIVVTDLSSQKIDGHRVRWYSPATVLAETPPEIEFMFVDGPPAWERFMDRYPALPMLASRLGPNAIVCLDDGDRPGERVCAESWERKYGFQRQYLPSATGLWILKR